MKALSMKQPVPELILQGKKTIELWHWNTNLRGTFALHASQNELEGFGLDPKSLPKGAILGTVELVDVIEFNSLEQFQQFQGQHLARNKNWFAEGKTYGFKLKNQKRFEKPIPVKGKLHFFEVDL
ncbi:ASCH domain-containing protein [Candidatus Woesearchaeota archaeon]|nr:ASCH domain-containing protein [Candidatus Woesearchaeota archaeon]